MITAAQLCSMQGLHLHHKPTYLLRNKPAPGIPRSRCSQPFRAAPPTNARSGAALPGPSHTPHSSHFRVTHNQKGGGGDVQNTQSPRATRGRAGRDRCQLQAALERRRRGAASTTGAVGAAGADGMKQRSTQWWEKHRASPGNSASAGSAGAGTTSGPMACEGEGRGVARWTRRCGHTPAEV